MTHPTPPDATIERADLVVVGAGIGGLIAAVSAARATAGRRIVVLEAHQPGGRARCDLRGGFTFNRGPRALYVGGPADQALTALGIATRTGGPPSLDGAVARCGGRLHRFPGTAADAARTTLLGGREKVALGRLLAAVWRAEGAALDHQTLSDWLDQRQATGRPRAFIEALVRVSTYADAADLIAAGPALANARAGIRPGVRYLDGGWQSLVDQLLALARSLGVEVRTAAARSVRSTADGPVVRHGEGATLRASTVVIAGGGPDAAARLLGERPASWGPLGAPVTAACLELGVTAPPRHRFALGIDVPWYASTHAPPARLAPDGMAVVQLMRYQRPDEQRPASEQQADLRGFATELGIEPEQIVEERFLARMVVAGSLPAAATGGMGGRPAVEVPEHPGVLVAGDWVGPDGLLLDAVAASATTAGRQAAARSATMVPA